MAVLILRSPSRPYLIPTESLTREQRLDLLDTGDGFPGSENVKFRFEEIAIVINPALDQYF